jgi:hypothetical protein
MYMAIASAMAPPAPPQTQQSPSQTPRAYSP